MFTRPENTRPSRTSSSPILYFGFPNTIFEIMTNGFGVE